MQEVDEEQKEEVRDFSFADQQAVQDEYFGRPADQSSGQLRMRSRPVLAQVGTPQQESIAKRINFSHQKSSQQPKNLFNKPLVNLR